jgi:hypothetical protein
VCSSTDCPACGATGQFSQHAVYRKYFFALRIPILRIRCRECGVTHALIPEFSLPGTSIGTAEAEAYLKERDEGVGRGTAGAKLLEAGMSERYPSHLDRMFSTAVARAKVLFPEAADPTLHGMSWVVQAVGTDERPILALNRYCLEHRRNCLCFCRASIIIFALRSAAWAASHNRGSPG